MLKGVIFDLDGVICHTDKYHYAAWKRLADRLGVYFDENINNRLRGIGRAESLEIILEKSKTAYSQEEKERFAEEKNSIYRSLLSGLTPLDLSEEVSRTLEELRQNGLKLAIGSSSKNAKFILERLGLSDYFDAVSDGDNIAKPKPEPEVFLKAAEYLRLNPAECLVVEDAVAGIQAAISGGFKSAGIGEAALCDGVDMKLNKISDIVAFVSNGNLG
jgi:beta-phosphoglucomutase